MASWKLPVGPEPDIARIPLLKSRKFFAVEYSQATLGGSGDDADRPPFVDALHKAHPNPGDSISFWSEECTNPSSNFGSVKWKSRPRKRKLLEVFKNESVVKRIKKSDVCFIVTNARACGVERYRIADLAYKQGVLQVPIVFVIFGSRGRTPQTTDIEIGRPIFDASENSAILLREDETGKYFVIAGRGCFAPLWPGLKAEVPSNWKSTPAFHDEAAFFEHCGSLNIEVPTAKSRKKLPKGISLGSDWERVQGASQRIDLDALLDAGILSDADLFALCSEETLRNLAIACRTRRETARLESLLKAQIVEEVVPRLEDVAGAAAIIRQLDEPTISEEARKTLQSQLREAHNKNRQQYMRTAAEFSSSTGAKRLGRRNLCVKQALERLAAMDCGSYGTNSSSAREPSTSQDDETQTGSNVDMASWDFEDSTIRGSCLICCDDGVIMSICLKHPLSTAENVATYARHDPLVAGEWHAYRDIVSSQNICYQCALLSEKGTTIYQEPIRAIIPVVGYKGKNVKLINQLLRVALGSKGPLGAEPLGDSEITQFFIAILDRILRTKSWAGAGLDESGTGGDAEDLERRRIYRWMLDELIEGVKVPKDLRTAHRVGFPQALLWAAQDFDRFNIQSRVINYPDAGFPTLLSLGNIKGVFSEDTIRRIRIAKALHVAIKLYIRDRKTTGQACHESWNHNWMKLIYSKFNSKLVPMDLHGSESLVTDVDDFFRLLKECVGPQEYLDAEMLPESADKLLLMRKIQLAVFWLIFKFSGGVPSVARFISRVQQTQHYGYAVMEPSCTVPESELHSFLLSIFPSSTQDARPIDSEAARLHTGYVPFKSPFGPSVLRCGIEKCGESFHIGDPNDSPNNIRAIIHARTNHLIKSYGLLGRFEKSTGFPQPITGGNPPGCVHTNIHQNIVCTWASMSVPERQAVVSDAEKETAFVEKVKERIGAQHKGNIYAETIEDHVRNVLPSFYRVLKEALRLEGKCDDDIAIYQHNFQNKGLKWKIEYELRAEGLIR